MFLKTAFFFSFFFLLFSNVNGLQTWHFKIYRVRCGYGHMGRGR
jgi:hypothetical protein